MPFGGKKTKSRRTRMKTLTKLPTSRSQITIGKKALQSLCALALALLFVPLAIADATNKKRIEIRSPNDIIEQSGASSWRQIDDDNTLYIQLHTGRVIVELSPEFAPNHVKNIKSLAREGFYEGLSIYRFVEGFVAQGGDQSGTKSFKKAKRELKSERFSTTEKIFTPLGYKDGFAPQTGFVNGFAVAKNDKGESWLVHCPGAFAMARGDLVDSGGTEFYIVLGHAPRYLDRNVSVFGRVIDGMQNVQSLQRQSANEQPINIIKSVRVAADLTQDQRENWQTMKTDSADFKEIITSRAQRPEGWFVERPHHVDVCGVPVPTRLSK